MKFWYIIKDCGDGSAAVSFFKDEETFNLGVKVQGIEDEKYGGFAEDCTGSVDTDIEDHFTTKEELNDRLKDLEE